MFVADTVWVVSLLYVVSSELKEIHTVLKYARRGVWRALVDEYLGLWNMVDWVSICTAVVILSLIHI